MHEHPLESLLAIIDGQNTLRWLQTGDCAVSRSVGRLQVAILEHMQARHGDDHIGGLGKPLFIAGPGIHDMRFVAEEMTSPREFSEPRVRAAFSWVVRGLVERGRLEPL